MEQRITGREIMLFILRFDLVNAYLETEYTSTDGSFELRAPGFRCEECSYVLKPNGDYLVEGWILNKDKGRWEQAAIGNIFNWRMEI